MKATITARYAPCTCGCHGTDPWHAAKFDRVLRNVRPVSGTVVLRMNKASGRESTVVEMATVKLPWGDETAYRVVDFGSRGQAVDMGWYLG